MRIRRRPVTPLILILSLASLVVATNADISQTATNVVVSQAQDPLVDPPSLVTGKLGNKGTKYAPVDGKDGIPHAGPFVDSEDRKKTDTSAGEPSIAEKQAQLVNKPSDPSILDEIPQSNDGVMDDPKRESPKVGTTGTEGGITEKDKARKAKEGQTGARVEKIPDSPKEALPPPDQPPQKDAAKKANQKKDPVAKDGKKDGKKEEKDEAIGGLEKPADLPEKTHDVPHPVPESANKAHLDVSKPKSTKEAPDVKDVEGIIQPFHSYVLALTMILFSEIGDKTFLIAALMAMKHDRMLVFSAAFSALVAMTVLSAVLGHAAPLLFPKRFTNFLASGLFLVFGVRLLREGLTMSPDEGIGEEMKEVEMELAEKEHQARKRRRRGSASPYALEMGMGSRTRKSRSSSRLPEPPRSPSSSPDRSPHRGGSTVNSIQVGLSNLCSLLLSPAWVQTFIMTFLGEWGDRSQIATIAMAAGQDYWWVTSGAISGHAMCTGVAVIGGRAIAGKVSLRVVTLGGAIAFLVFGVIYLLEAFYYP